MSVGLRERAERAPYHRSLGIRVEELTPERVRLRVPYKDENSNPGRALHGGVAASAIDVAGVLAAWAGTDTLEGLDPRTLDLTVTYLAAAIGEDVLADAAVLRRGKEIVYSEVDVRTDEGKRIATGLVTHRLAPPAPPGRTLAQPAEPGGDGAGEIPPLARALVSLPFIAGRGMRIIHMAGGAAAIAMPARPENADEGGALHEGALAALLDTTGAMASWSLVGLDVRYRASTVGIHVSYHDRASDDVVARGRTLRRADESFLNTVTVHEPRSGRVIATGSVTYRIVVPG